jgi:magnesium chelatase subunit D
LQNELNAHNAEVSEAMSNDAPEFETWHDALTSLQLLQIDPAGFGGIWLRAPFGPVREQWLKALMGLDLNTVKVPGSVDLERLLGGIDLSRTLQTGSLHMQSGLLQQAHQGVVCISMAERFPASLIAPMTQAMDTHTVPALTLSADSNEGVSSKFGVVALDESMSDDPPLSQGLQERLGLWLDLQTLPPSEVQDLQMASSQQRDGHAEEPHLKLRIKADDLATMQGLIQRIEWTHDQVTALCASALSLGIDSLRVPTLALKVAACHAALNLRDHITDEDLAFAARRVLAPRATQWPSSAEASQEAESQHEPEASNEEAPDEQETQPPEQNFENSEESNSSEEPAPKEPTQEDLQEMMVAAALASLPPHVLDALMTTTGKSQGNTSGRSGQYRAGSQRGRPLPPRPGRPGGHARLHVLATLRAAAPKQKLRGAKQQGRVAIRSEDFHVHRFQQNSSSCLILALDASGSAALQRLAEAKGAVELLLQQSYARRDSVCIVAFRGAQAQLLLPMTRSLVRAKRAMTGLPGGGGTPLALALKMACEQATQLHRQGVTPILVVLSDGRANVTLQGLGGRAQAQAEAAQWGTQWRLTGHRSLWIDTSIQPDPQVQLLANTMGGSYMPMPQVQSQRMASAMNNLRQQAT